MTNDTNFLVSKRWFRVQSFKKNIERRRGSKKRLSCFQRCILVSLEEIAKEITKEINKDKLRQKHGVNPVYTLKTWQECDYSINKKHLIAYARDMYSKKTKKKSYSNSATRSLINLKNKGLIELVMKIPVSDIVLRHIHISYQVRGDAVILTEKGKKRLKKY
jgi:aconitase A